MAPFVGLCPEGEAHAAKVASLHALQDIVAESRMRRIKLAQQAFLVDAQLQRALAVGAPGQDAGRIVMLIERAYVALVDHTVEAVRIKPLDEPAPFLVYLAVVCVEHGGIAPDGTALFLTILGCTNLERDIYIPTLNGYFYYSFLLLCHSYLFPIKQHGCY